VFEVVQLSIQAKALVIFRENICIWADLIFFCSKGALHFKHVAPEVIFPSNMPSSRIMIDFLTKRNILNSLRLD